MNRLTYLLKAKTEYNLHSPFIYRLYTQVITTHKHDFTQLVNALADWSSAYGSELHPNSALISSPLGEFMVVRSPHSNRQAEQQFQQLQQQYPVSIDLYRMAVLIRSPKLHPQKFILR